MAVRIETLEQLKNPSLVEQVTDRLRRTNAPRKFIFKVRCKEMGDKPVLLSAPPGRKVKSSLVRKLRLGSPTLKGVVHREGKVLYFTFSSEVNKKKTQRWLAHFLHKAKSPVPLHNIVILCPSDKKSKDSGEEKRSKSRVKIPKMEDPPPINESIIDIKWSQNDQTEVVEEIDIDEIHDALESDDALDRMDALQEEMDLLDQILKEHVSNSDFIRLRKLRHDWEDQQDRVEEIMERQSNLEAKNEDIQEEIERINQLIEQEKKDQENDIWAAQIQAWKDLENEVKASDLQMDTLREILSNSSLPVKGLSKELQFMEDEWPAFLAIREFCTIGCEQAEKAREDSPKRIARYQEQIQEQEDKHSENEDKLGSLVEKLARNETRLEKRERFYWEEQTRLVKKTAQSLLNSGSSDINELIQQLSASEDEAKREVAIALRQLS